MTRHVPLDSPTRHRNSWIASLAVAAAVVLGTVRPGAAQSGQDDALLQRLETTRVDVDYAPEDLSRVIDDLRTEQGLNVQVAWPLLDSMGIRKDRRVEIQLRQVPLSVLLDTLVRELDPTGGNALAWGVEQGIVQLTRADALARRTTLRIHDVRDLLESGYAFRRFANTPVLALELTGRELLGGEIVSTATPSATREKAGGGGFGGGGGGSGGGSIFGSPGEEPEQVSRMERVDDLVRLIQQQVEPDTWIDNGGSSGMIDYADGSLVVRQTARAQRAIAELLGQLRAAAPAPLYLDAAIVRLSPRRASEVRESIGSAFPMLDDGAFRRVASDEGVLFRGNAAGVNGEAFWLSDVRQSQAVQALDGLVGEQATLALPRLGSVDDGLELIVLPLLLQDGDRVRLDVQMAVKAPTEFEARDTPAASIDLARQRMRTVSSTATVRLGDAIALAIPARPSADGAALDHEEWLVLRVRRAPTG